MKIDELYIVVHGLSVQQKSNFSRFTNGKEGNLPIKLYERILRQTEFSPESLKKIREGEFYDSNKFRNNRNLLIDLIIKSIAHYEFKSLPVSSYVYGAIQIGVFEKAESIIFDEMRRIQKLDDLSELVRLHDFVQELELYHGLQIHRPTDIVSYEDAIDGQKHRRELIIAIKELKRAIKLGEYEREVVVDSVIGIVEKQSFSQINQCLSLLAKVRFAYLKKEFQNAINFGKTLVFKMKSKLDLFPIKMIVNEIELVATLAILTEDRSLAVQYSLELSALSSQFDDFAHETKKRSIRLGATVAAGFHEKSLASVCLQDLRSNNHFLDTKSLIISYFNIGRCFFFHEDFANVIECMVKVRNHLKKEFNNLTWEPQAMLAIAYFEIGDYDQSDSFLRSASRYASKNAKRYPNEAIVRIKRYLSQEPNGSPAFTEKDLVIFKRILSDPEEKRESNNFPIQIWIEAQIRRIPTFNLIKDLPLQPVSEADFLLLG
jgi:tetratricopeptide (TPR) repeat protein